MLSTLGSASLQNLSAALRRHSLSESVHFVARSLFRLISSFHIDTLLKFFLFDYKEFSFFRQAITIPFLRAKLNRDCVYPLYSAR